MVKYVVLVAAAAKQFHQDVFGDALHRDCMFLVSQGTFAQRNRTLWKKTIIIGLKYVQNAQMGIYMQLINHDASRQGREPNITILFPNPIVHSQLWSAQYKSQAVSYFDAGSTGSCAASTLR